MGEAPATKVFSTQALRAELDKINAEKKIVFTNGCFDLLHPGHVYGLMEASRCGDYLIVGINSDESVRRLKGPERPILAQDDRAMMLSALACVDAVVVFEEDTPVQLIKVLKPDIHVKGSDYSGKDIPERKTVQAYGGQVKFVEMKPGWSTTSFLERMKSLETPPSC